MIVAIDCELFFSHLGKEFVITVRNFDFDRHISCFHVLPSLDVVLVWQVYEIGTVFVQIVPLFSREHQSSAQERARRSRVMSVIKSRVNVSSTRTDWRTAGMVISSQVFPDVGSRYRRRKQIYLCTQYTRPVAFTLLRNISLSASR